MIPSWLYAILLTAVCLAIYLLGVAAGRAPREQKARCRSCTNLRTLYEAMFDQVGYVTADWLDERDRADQLAEALAGVAPDLPVLAEYRDARGQG